jgi:hypothetical protein
MTMTERPPVSAGQLEVLAGHPGLEAAAVPSGSDWQPMEGRKCRRLIRPQQHRYCGQPSVLAVRRNYRGRPEGQLWPYCPEHSYGRWVEDGKVMHWILREKSDGSE